VISSKTLYVEQFQMVNFDARLNYCLLLLLSGSEGALVAN
jgi:hypothetical protein